MKALRHLLSRLLASFYYVLAESHRYFGNKTGLKEEYESAIGAFTRAVAYDPGFARAYMERGILYWREVGQPQRAIHDLTLAYDLDSSLIEARFNRGIAHQQLNETKEALVDFKAYLAEGVHPYWREYAETMIRELEKWVSENQDGPSL